MGSAARYVRRVLGRDPGPTALAIVSLAIAIGASTAIFSLADALFLRPLAVRDPDRLVNVNTRDETGRLQNLSFPEYQDVRGVPAFEDVALFDERGATYRDGDDLELLLLAAVSDNYFPLLGVRPALGRLFAPGLDRSGLSTSPVVISHRLWQRRFGGDPAIAGKPVRLSDRVCIVLGVVPQAFRGLERGPVTDVWIDLETWTRYYGHPSALLARRQRSFEVVARLRAKASVAEADAQLAALAQRWRRDYPDEYRRRTLVAATADDISGASGSRLALLLVSIVALVVLIAAVNVATLRLAQGDARRRELGVRLAVGAPPARLARQLLGEGMLVVAIATVGGMLFGAWLIRAAPAFLPPAPVAIDFGIALDRRVLAVTLAMAAVAAALSGVVPALRASRTDVIGALKASVERGPRVRLLSLRTLLVASQVALAVVLVNGAGLLLQGFLATRSTWPGFATHKELLVVTLTAPDVPDALRGWDRALSAMRERVAGLPGVARATYVRRIPMAGYGGGATLLVSLPGNRGSSESRALRYNQIGPDYLPTLGTRLVRGRFFEPSEHRPSARVVVISEALARQSFQAADPLGRYVTIDRDEYQIVGIVENTRIARLHEAAEPFFYLPFAVRPSEDVALVLETNVPAGTLARAARQAVRAVNPEARVLMTTTMHDHMAEQVYDEWMPAVLGTALAAIGVGLALVGLYGAVALLTVRRTRELGIRLALGAAPRRIVSLVLAQGIVIAAAGAIVGVVLALASGTVVASILRSRGAHDTAILLASAGAALLIGTLAAVIPAARTLRIDPSRTLRYE